MSTCRHNPSHYDSDPDTGDVYCFACTPPRLVSNPREIPDEVSIDDLRTAYYDAQEYRDKIGYELATLQSAYDVASIKVEEAFRRWEVRWYSKLDSQGADNKKEQ